MNMLTVVYVVVRFVVCTALDINKFYIFCIFDHNFCIIWQSDILKQNVL